MKLDGDRLAQQLSATVDELLAAQDQARALSLENAREQAKQLVHTHSHDPNFSSEALERMQAFLANTALFEDSEKHPRASEEAKIEICLLTKDSPYAEVRAVVSPDDDPDIPCGTIRAWGIGIIFVIILAFTNQLFSVLAQFLAYPVGKAAERFLPDVGITLFGIRHSLNPGPFNKKEHMFISIMATVGRTLPSSRNIIFTQWIERYFNQPYAKSFAYQILLALSTDLMGFGLAGLCRRFLVYPSFCVWPRSLVTIALNSSLHNEENHSVLGPFKTVFSISRYRFFLITFGCMFVYFYLFNWIAWIAPNNFNLTAITGLNKGLGINPFPTFDWNIFTHAIDPLVVPFHITVNMILGMAIGGVVIIGMYWTNAYNTAYLPINTNSMFNHFEKSYNVSMILDEQGWLDEAKYQAYSPVYLAASSLTMYFYFFAMYAATVSYAYLYHRHDIALGMRSLIKGFRKGDTSDFKDVHSRLMSAYKEVPEWWYAILNVLAIVFGVAAIAAWPTFTNVGVVFFGMGLALVFVIPTGIIEATTGIEVSFNVLAESIGGAWSPGNALAMNFFKCYGYVTIARALAFANDLKLAHYVKMPPRQSFTAQVVAAIISAFISSGVMNFQITQIKDICESTQKDRFTCITSPLSHPAIFPAYLSMKYLRSRYLAFWAKYNYVVSAAFDAAIAIAGLVIFFAVSYHGFYINRWGNESESGCESTACTRLSLPEGGYFGDGVGGFA
ncbi:hypothetical protein BDV12DRAFT_205518 [Aspergillus spectabilis]